MKGEGGGGLRRISLFAILTEMFGGGSQLCLQDVLSLFALPSNPAGCLLTTSKNDIY